MTVYPTFQNTTSPNWPAPIEPIWQMLPANEISHPGWKRPDLGLSDRLFIGAVINLPRHQREWGVVQWLTDTYQTSRPTLYAIGARTKAGLLTPASQPSQRDAVEPKPADKRSEKTVAVTKSWMIRTALTLLFP